MKIFREGEVFAPVQAALDSLEHCIVKDAVCGFRYPFFAPGGYGNNWWQLDSSSALEGYQWHDFAFAKRSLLNFPEVQREDGRIPLYGPDLLPKSPHHSEQSDNASSLPTLFPVAYRTALASGDRAYAETVFQMLARYSDWWQENRVDKATGLVTALFEETFPPYLGRAGEYVGVDTCVFAAMGASDTANLAALLGYGEQEAFYRARSKALFSAAETYLWDEETGLFRPREPDGTFGVCSAEGFYMLADPALPKERKERLLSAMKGAAFGWERYPLCSVSRVSPAFCITRGEHYQFNESWSGMVWSLINRWIVHGLDAAGCRAEAVTLAEKTVSLIGCECREFYDPDIGDGHGAHDYAWTASHLLALLLEIMLGIRYDGFRKVLTVQPAVSGKWEITSLCCGTDGYADLVIENGALSDVRFRENTVEIKAEQ